MKKFYLFLLTMMVSFVSAFADQKPVPNFSTVVSGTDYYLYNVEYEGFLVGANDWGTRASVSRESGLKINISASGNTYKLGAMSPDNADGVWIDGSRAGNDQFTLTPATDGTYQIGCTRFAGTVLTWTGDENNTRVNFTTTTTNGTWGLVTQADYDAYWKAINDAREANGDYTGRMSNDKANWTGAGGLGVYGGGVEYYLEVGQPQGNIISQTISGLPSGKYQVKFYGISNVARILDVNTYAGAGIAYVFANGVEEDITVGTLSGLDDAAWAAGERTINCEVGEDGTLRYGLANRKAGSQWAVVKAISLIRTGDLNPNPGPGPEPMPEPVPVQFANSNFAEGTVGDVNIATYAKDGNPNQMQEVPSWTFGVENGDARAAGVVAYGSGTTLGGTTYGVPAAGPEGTNGNALAMVGVWTGTVQYVQNVNLPAGKYAMIVPVYNTAGTNALAKNLIGVKVGQTEYNAKTSIYPIGKWTTEYIVFEVPEEQTVTVSVGVVAPNAGSAACQHLFIDRVEIETYQDVKEAKVQALGNLPTAGEGIFAVSADDIAAAKEAINNAKTILDVKAAAAKATPAALKGAYTIFNKTANNFLGTDAENVALSSSAVKTTFEAAGNGTYYIKAGDVYINMKGGNTWSMSADATPKTAWAFTLNNGAYEIKGPNGLIGSDNTAAGEWCYGNKKVDQNGLWLIEKFVNPGGGAMELNSIIFDAPVFANSTNYAGASKVGVKVPFVCDPAELVPAIYVFADYKILEGTDVVAEGSSDFIGAGTFWVEDEDVAKLQNGHTYTIVIPVDGMRVYNLADGEGNDEDVDCTSKCVYTNVTEVPVGELTPGGKQKAIALSFTFDEATGINGIANSLTPVKVYDLTGREVKAMTRGSIYIVNGKKMLVK